MGEEERIEMKKRRVKVIAWRHFNGKFSVGDAIRLEEEEFRELYGSLLKIRRGECKTFFIEVCS